MDQQTRLAFWHELLTIDLELDPDPWRIAFLEEWARWENTGARFNPLATTQPGHEDPNNPYWNTFGDNGQYHVRNYATFSAGITATGKTLLNGLYQPIIDALYRHWIHDASELAAALRTWGTKGFADIIEQGWHPAPLVNWSEPATGIRQLDNILASLNNTAARLDDHDTAIAALNRAILARLALASTILADLLIHSDTPNHARILANITDLRDPDWTGAQ